MYITVADIYRAQGVSESDIQMFGGPKRGTAPISWGHNAYCDWHWRKTLYARDHAATSQEYFRTDAPSVAAYIARPWKYLAPDPGPCPQGAIFNDCGGSFNPAPLILALGALEVLAPLISGAASGSESAVGGEVSASASDAAADIGAATEVAPEIGSSVTEAAAETASESLSGSAIISGGGTVAGEGFDLGGWLSGVESTAAGAAADYANSQIGRLFGGTGGANGAQGTGPGIVGGIQGPPASGLGFGSNTMVFIVIGIVALILLAKK